MIEWLVFDWVILVKVLIGYFIGFGLGRIAGRKKAEKKYVNELLGTDGQDKE